MNGVETSLAVMFAMGALAMSALGAVILAWTAQRRTAMLERRAATLEAANEQLQDQVWELRESEERYRSLIEGQDDLILRRDGFGRLTYVNEAFAAMADRPREALLGTTYAIPAVETQHREPRQDGSLSYDQAIEAGAGLRWVSWIQTPVRSARGETEIQAVGRDVTDRRRAEAALAEARARAEAGSEAKSRFLATVSHEIRTPLNGVLGMADLLLGTRIDAEQTTYVQAVKTSGQALLSIIDEILDFSKIEAGKLELSYEPFDLTALVEGTVELLAPRAQGKGVEIASYIGAAVPRRLMGDAARLRQVLTNLAGNAVKFTDAGGVGLRVTAAPGGMVRFEIADTGVGIPADRIGRIFEEFEQADGSASSRHGGTGLGLAISRRLVAGMGGELTVASTPGEGSTFAFVLPFKAVADGTQPASPALLAGRSVLVVSRSPYEAPFLARRLADAGAAARTVGDPLRAQEILEEERPGVLIVDGAIGEDEARTLAAAAKASGVKTRIVLLSPFERRAFGPPGAAGFDAYLVKPVREHSLAARLSPQAEILPVQAEATAPDGEPQACRALSVLLAEDNEINALLATRLLQRNGATVTLARNGIEAVARFQACVDGEIPDFDLVLMDVRMPGLDGHEAVRRIREIEAAHGRPRLRIVALTANAFEEDRRLAIAAGMDDTLAKPIDEAGLVAALGGTVAAVRVA